MLTGDNRLTPTTMPNIMPMIAPIFTNLGNDLLLNLHHYNTTCAYVFSCASCVLPLRECVSSMLCASQISVGRACPIFQPLFLENDLQINCLYLLCALFSGNAIPSEHNVKSFTGAKRHKAHCLFLLKLSKDKTSRNSTMVKRPTENHPYAYNDVVTFYNDFLVALKYKA